MNNLNVKTGDNVVVIAGKDKGKTGKVISADPKKGRVRVENVNIITKHKKPRSAQVPGGKFKEAGSIDVSNVQIICPSCSKATRVGHSESEGKKVRSCKKCGASLDFKVKLDKKGKKKAEKSAEVKPKKSTAKPKKTETAKETAPEVKAADVEVKEKKTAAKPKAEKTGKPAAKPKAKKEEQPAPADEKPSDAE